MRRGGIPRSMDRTSFFHAGLDRSMPGIEIGPSYRPIFPKSDGWNVIVADHADRAQLVRKYQAWGVDTTKMEEVDVVLGASGLDAISPRGHYAYLAASHVIEHVPDPIGFLHSAAGLLVPGGALRLAVPDKRYCFDLLKPVSTAGQLVQAHVERRSRHTLGQYVDALMLHVTRRGEIVFPDVCADDPLSFAHPAAEAYAMARRIDAGREDVDVHGWVFTPSSFAAVLGQLAAIGLLPFRIRSIVPDGRHEFLVDAVRAEPGTGPDPAAVIDMLRAALREQADPVVR